jgi:ubiquinol-cytochrome c reductase cytochrome b subunit
MKIVKGPLEWFNDRTGLVDKLGPLLKHPVPPDTGWMYVFGTAVLTSFAVQILTGIMLATMYVPSSSEAYRSLEFITHDATLGSFVRGMHYWGASAMILFLGVHMIRVFLTGSYKFPREMSWISGLFLLLFTVGMGFSGQTLRWDQNAVWSIVVGAEQVGRVPYLGQWLARLILTGGTLTSVTLSRFFALHVFILSGLIIATLGFHLYLVLRNGISEPPKPGCPVEIPRYRESYRRLLAKSGVPFWPNAIWRDAVFSLAVVAGIMLLAWLVGPPALGRHPNPSIVQAQPRPDWYLLWYFAVLALLPHAAEKYVIVLGPLVAGLALILLPFAFRGGERDASRRPWSVAAVAAIVISVAVLWRAGVTAKWSPDFNAKPLPRAVVGATSGPVFVGSQLFFNKGCIYCHSIARQGGRRGPDLTTVGSRLTRQQMIIRVSNGGYNMPGYGGILDSAELAQLVGFLESRQSQQ